MLGTYQVPIKICHGYGYIPFRVIHAIQFNHLTEEDVK